MDAERLTGQLVVGGLDAGRLTPELESALREGRLGGLILFRRDMESLEATARLVDHARALSPAPILIGMDEEGGIASQIDGLPVADGSTVRAQGAPSPASLAALNDEALTEAVFGAVGRVLRAAGVDIAFAPLLDVNSRSANPVIGRRSFGSDPDHVARHGLAAILGLQREGVIPCAKHFPGHGAASEDSHLTLPVIAEPYQTLMEDHVAPFAEAVRQHVPLVMTAHVAYPALDPESGRPATCSWKILTDLLRGTLGFRGAVISDALEMVGFSGGTRDDAALREALTAGVDIFLVCQGSAAAERVRTALLRAGQEDPRAMRRLEEARRHQDALLGLGRGRGESSGFDPRVPIRDVVADVAPLLKRAHAEATTVEAVGPVASPASVALVLPAAAPSLFLDGAMAAACVRRAAARTHVVTYGDGMTFTTEDLGDSESVLLVLFTRGSSPTAADREAIRVVEAWQAEAAGRAAFALAAADHHVLRMVPDGWGKTGMTGSHESAFVAALGAVFGPAGASGGQKSV